MPEMRSHDDTVLQQFDPRANAYLTSAVHAAGPDLDLAVRQARRLTSRVSMLDVGCGAGHLTFALAPFFETAVATDVSPSMLATVLAVAGQRRLPQIQVRRANAQALPFADATFDLVCSRYSAHHWHDLAAALQEMRRVARPGATLLMIDLLGDESSLVDTHLQAVELLRDPSHVRDYSPSQWRAHLQAAGFVLQREAFWTTRLEFSSWTQRMHTPPASVAAIRRLLAEASGEVRSGLAVEEDGSFAPRTGLFCAKVPMP
jgi:ubiquinone/menaquinone biosynthesis C-methylase UbiE